MDVSPTRSQKEIERAEDVYCQLQYLGLESLTNLFYSVEAEIRRKGGKSPVLRFRKITASPAL